MRKLITRLTLSLLVIGVATWAVVSHNRSEGEQEHDLQRQQRKALTKIVVHRNETVQSIVRMASAHNVVTDWTNAFSGARFAEMLASRELAPVLVRKDGRPLLVFGSIVDVVTQDDGCKLEVDAKANLVSNIRFWLTCTPAQVKEALSHREEAREEALEEIREDAGDPEEETPRQKQDDDRQIERMVRQGYAVIARVETIHSEVADTIDYPPAKAQFTFAEGHCLDLLYVGRDYTFQAGDEAYLRINSSEDERLARLEMKLRAQMHSLAHEMDKKENH